ncbi:MAG: PPOX class F420-dependent oxidoreductase [Terracoccus sp.]
MTSPGQAPTLAEEHFVSLVTFRRNGDPVPTPVWVVGDDDLLWVTTPDGTGKLRRLARDPHVEVVACDRRGRVPEGAVPVSGSATVHRDAVTVDRVMDLTRRKHRVETAVFGIVEKIFMRGKDRVAIAITVTGERPPATS